MGRATFDSIGRPLPGRKNIVVSRNPDCEYTGATVVSTLDSALEIARSQAEIDGVDEVMIIGGASIYAASNTLVERIYFTEVKADVFGDARFELPDLSNWREVARTDHKKCKKNPYDYSFIVYERE